MSAFKNFIEQAKQTLDALILAEKYDHDDLRVISDLIEKAETENPLSSEPQMDLTLQINIATYAAMGDTTSQTKEEGELREFREKIANRNEEVNGFGRKMGREKKEKLKAVILEMEKFISSWTGETFILGNLENKKEEIKEFINSLGTQFPNTYDVLLFSSEFELEKLLIQGDITERIDELRDDIERYRKERNLIRRDWE